MRQEDFRKLFEEENDTLRAPPFLWFCRWADVYPIFIL